MEWVIRDAVMEDADQLAHITVTANESAFAGLVPDVCLAFSEAESAANWRRSIAGEFARDTFLVAQEPGGRVIGYALAGPVDDDPQFQAELFTLNMLPARQRQGVGRRLVVEIARRLAEQGIHSLKVGVLRINPNRPFYERLGGEYLYDRPHTWEGVVFPECFYGWRDTAALAAGGER